jgi:hypothetical protein
VSEAADEGKGIPLTRSSHDLVRKRAETGTQPKSLMRMFSVNRHAKGTPDRHPKGTPFITDYARPMMFLCSADRGCFFVPA